VVAPRVPPAPAGRTDRRLWVALILGWAILSEEITPTILVGALMILACVAVAARGEER